MEQLTIGKAARRAGVGVETIRFYERRGLIPQPPKRESGYRQYTQEVVSCIRFIRDVKELGFTLREIGELLSLLETTEIDCSTAERIAESKVAEIDMKIQSMQTMKRALLEFKQQCAEQSPDGMCIINEIYQPNKTGMAIESLRKSQNEVNG